jgi:Zn-dependent protease with chaperone function
MSFVVLAFLMSVGFIASCGVGAIVDALWRMRGSREVHPWALSAPRTALVMPAMGLVVALVSLLPAKASTWLRGACACELYGGLHVCPFHFDHAAPLLLLALPVALVLLTLRARGVLTFVQRLRDLQHLVGVGERRGDDLVSVDCGGKPVIFVAGLVQPRIVVEASWWERLSPRERAVIWAHERAHVEARDPWGLAVLELVLRLVAPRACARIIRDWTLASEMRADARAAEEDGDPAYVAEALVRYARAAAPDGALGLGGSELDARVRALLDGHAPCAVIWTPSTCALAFAAACVSGHAAHRLFEALLTLLP